MPKKLDSVREKAIARTRQVLQEQGYEALAMRDIAAACGVAVGTMYNYFPSKEYLTGCVVLEDWKAAYNEMIYLTGSADSMGHGLQGIYGIMLRFVADHQYLTAYDRRKTSGDYDYESRHSLLCRQIEELLEMLQARFGCRLEPEISAFLAENIVSCSVRKYDYAQVAPALMKLLT